MPIETTYYTQLDGSLVELCTAARISATIHGEIFGSAVASDGGVFAHGCTHSAEQLTVTAKGTRQLLVNWNEWQKPM